MTYIVSERMRVSPLWDRGYRGDGVTVAVLDSGVKPNPTFADRIVYDEDFTGQGRPRGNSYSHGNSVVACVLDIAPEAHIANCRVIPNGSNMTREVVIKALEHCIEVYPRYRVVNMSLSFNPAGCPHDCPLCKKVEEAYRKGIFVIVAAGNKGPAENTLTCPALAEWAIHVMATGPNYIDDDYYKGLQGWVRRTWEIQVTGTFGKKFGTSYSAGYASGSAAILFSAFPKLDADTLRFAMTDTAETLRQEVGHHTTLKIDRVYQRLLQLQALVSAGAMVIKEGALYPFVEPF